MISLIGSQFVFYALEKEQHRFSIDVNIKRTGIESLLHSIFEIIVLRSVF